MTPRITSLTTSHIAKETRGWNIMCLIFDFFYELFAELRSSSTPASQQPPPGKQFRMVQGGFMS
jgi:hypothetical protein